MTQGVNNNRPVNDDLSTGGAGAPAAVAAKQSPAVAAEDDVGGAPKQAETRTGARPELSAPTQSPAAMMIALQKLSMAMAEQTMKLGETSIKTIEKEIRDSALERVKELKKYFENLDKVNTKKKCGLFGFLIKFLKAVFTGNTEELKELGKTFKDNWLTMLKDALAVVVAIVALAATPVIGPVAVIGASLLLVGMVLTDPGIGDMIMEALPEDRRKAAMIALAVVGGVCCIAGGIMMGIATGGASTLATVSTVLTAISTLTEAGVTAYEGVEGYKQTGYKADAAKSQAQIDRTDAHTAELQGELSRKQSELKDLFDSLSAMLQSTRDMISAYGQIQNTAAGI
jgi:hypothetical protein